MYCPYCKRQMEIESRHENIVVWRCRDESCPGHLDKKYENTGEKPAPYNDAEQYSRESLINQENQKEE